MSSRYNKQNCDDTSNNDDVRLKKIDLSTSSTSSYLTELYCVSNKTINIFKTP